MQRTTVVLLFIIGIGTFSAIGFGRNLEDRSALPVEEVADLPFAESVAPNSVPATDLTDGDSLEFVRRLGSDDAFGKISSMHVAGTLMFVGDKFLSPHIAVLDLRDGRVLGRAGRDGKGPGEFQSPISMTAVVGADSSVWVHDFLNRRISKVTVAASGEVSVTETVPLAVQTTTEYSVALEESVVSAGLYGEYAVLMFFDWEGKPIGKTGRPPFSLRDVGHETGVRLVNRSSLTADPKLGRLAVSFYSANRIDVYSAKGRLTASATGPREISAAFYVKDDLFFWDVEENELAYTGITASDDAIFALFCGCAMDDPKPTDRTRIHVFSWGGKFLGELFLPYAAMKIEVNVDGTRLYTAVEDPWPGIVEWQIPSLR